MEYIWKFNQLKIKSIKSHLNHYTIQFEMAIKICI